jgi:hypothetical protein
LNLVIDETRSPGDYTSSNSLARTKNTGVHKKSKHGVATEGHPYKIATIVV